jgi:hypothetical protein
MPINSVSTLVEALRENQLLPPSQLREVQDLRASFVDWSLLSSDVALQDLTQELLRRGWLTDYQLDCLLQGRAAELVLGKYVLLEPLGEVRRLMAKRPEHRYQSPAAVAEAVARFFPVAEKVAGRTPSTGTSPAAEETRR